MKKIVLAAAAIAALSSEAALANMEDVFYVKINGGWDKLAKISGIKSKNDYFLGLGVGYYVMDNVRTDLVFEHLFKPQHKKTETDSDGDTFINNIEGKVNSLFLNGYVDLFDVSVAKFYVGAGLGMAQVSAKNKGAFVIGGVSDTETVNFKKKNNLAFALHLGASTEFAPGVNGELFYSYKDYGKTTPKNKDASGKLKYKGHFVGIGVRFDI